MTINKDPTHFESLYPENTRQEEIAKISSLIKEGKSCQIVGLPGSGRSNTLGLFSYNRGVREHHFKENQKWFHFVYMDFSEVKKRNLYEVTKFILISLSYSLSERNMPKDYEKANEFLKEGLQFQDELILFQSLKKTIDYLCIEKELTVVLLFDRFEQYLPDLTEQFFLDLKILRNRAKYRFSAVFTLPRPLEDILEPQVFAEFSEFLSGNTIYIKRFDPIGTDFRISYLEKVSGKKADDDTKKEIITLTGGLGKLTRLAYEAVLSYEEKIDDLKTFLLEKSTIKNSLHDIHSQLTPSEQTALQTQNFKDLRHLEQIGLIENGKIAIPLFEQYLKTLPQQPSSLKYDSSKNEIYKGNESLTEKLSPSEFRMLRHLLQNPDRVIEKEEIIQAVWKDTKTQEGVTDQALDQIIYRLRKKIEEDPNNPKYIQTVKGRGIKLAN